MNPLVIPSHRSGDLLIAYVYGNLPPEPPGWTKMRQPWWRRLLRWVRRKPLANVYWRVTT